MSVPMRADYLTYKQATGVSLLGMVIQGALAAVMLVYGILGRDHTAMTLAGLTLWSAFIWMSLAIVYDQHRRERIEAMEADALAASPTGGTSVFDNTAAEFRPAQRRLAGLYKYFFAAVSLVTTIAIVTFGYMRFTSGAALVDPLKGFIPPTLPGWGIGLTAVVSLVSFLLARYAAGMAKHTSWASLRAGASWTVGVSLLSLALAIAHFAASLKADGLVRYLQPAAGIMLMLLGAETLLSFILGIYRPRRADELPRPAFDSRLLGFAAAPDRIAQSISEAINYQLGFDVSSGWFFRLLSRALTPLLGMGVLVVWLLSSMAVVQPHQRAMVLRFGSPIRNDVGPGLHFKAPWPIDSIYIPEYMEPNAKGDLVVTDLTATGVRSVQLGTTPPATTEAILWTNEHSGTEDYQYVRPGGGLSRGSVDALGTTDLAMVSIEIPMHYVVEDVRVFDELAPPELRESLLKTIAMREVNRYFQHLTLGQIFGGDRRAMGEELKHRVEAAFAAINPGSDGKPRGAGVKVLSIGLLGVHPPKQAATAFETLVQADQRREANIDAARADAIKSLTQVVGDASLAADLIAAIEAGDQAADSAAATRAIEAKLETAGGETGSLLAQARAERWEKHMRERGRAARLEGQNALFEAAPDVYRARLYFETLASVIAGSRLYIVSDDVGRRIDVDLKDKDLGGELFRPENN